MSTFKFRKNSIIGAADADEDMKYLRSTFVNTGALSILCDCDDPRRIVLGRTGSGKTALLNMLEDVEDNVIRIPPENLSLSYISNSNILNFFAKAGVKLDIFYRLLWRHVLTVELLKARYKINDENAKKSFLRQMVERFTADKKKQQAINYLIEWGESFWEETEYRIKEVTQKLESELKGAVEGKVSLATLNVHAAERLSEEQKTEVVQRAQDVVDRVQIKKLSDVMDLMAEDVLNDPNQKYFLIVDKLDENWVEDSLRYRLIRALIETVRDFRKVKCLKVIIALRTDLTDRVYKLTRDAGFQEEKYESLYLNLAWDRQPLIELLDRRIDVLVKEQYTTAIVTHKDLLPKPIDDKSAIDYIIDRTMMRPRDVILFFNICLRYAEGKPTINRETLLHAEGEYSKTRLRALADEWFADYPDLMDFVIILKKNPRSFRLNQLDDQLLADFCLDRVSATSGDFKGLVAHANEFVEGRITMQAFKSGLFGIFYKIGIVGIRSDATNTLSWSFDGIRPNLSSSEITDDSKVYIHPSVWRVLGIHDRI